MTVGDARKRLEAMLSQPDDAELAEWLFSAGYRSGAHDGVNGLCKFDSAEHKASWFMFADVDEPKAQQ